MAIGYDGGHFRILHIYRSQLDFEGLRIALPHQIDIHKPAGVLIETTGGFGDALLSTLQNNHGPKNLTPYKPIISKQELLYNAWPMVEGGDVTLPESAPWLAEFRKELAALPAGLHDDKLAAMSQVVMNAKILLRKVGHDVPEKILLKQGQIWSSSLRLSLVTNRLIVDDWRSSVLTDWPCTVLLWPCCVNLPTILSADFVPSTLRRFPRCGHVWRLDGDASLWFD